MEGMFKECSSLINIDLYNFNTNNVTNMGYMFKRCSSLTNLIYLILILIMLLIWDVCFLDVLL